MDSTHTNPPASVPFRPRPSPPPATAPNIDRVREQLGWRLLQQNWHPGR